MIAVLVALALAEPAVLAPPASVEAQCYQLMAKLADSEDPAARSLGFTASLYFLGRMEAEGAGEAKASGPVSPVPELIGRCAEIMEKSGRDFSGIGALLEVRDRPDS